MHTLPLWSLGGVGFERASQRNLWHKNSGGHNGKPTWPKKMAPGRDVGVSKKAKREEGPSKWPWGSWWENPHKKTGHPASLDHEGKLSREKDNYEDGSNPDPRKQICKKGVTGGVNGEAVSNAIQVE